MEILFDEVKLAERVPEFAVMENQEELQKLQEDFEELFQQHPSWAGIAANQVGLDKRIIALYVNSKEVLLLCNPMIITQKGLHVGIEEDLSLPNREFLVARNDEIVLAYQTRFGISEE